MFLKINQHYFWQQTPQSFQHLAQSAGQASQGWKLGEEMIFFCYAKQLLRLFLTSTKNLKMIYSQST